MIEFKQGRHHEAIFLRPQRADVGGQLQRQHGHGAIGEVDAGAAKRRLAIDGRAGVDVVRHVRDMHVQGEVAVGKAIHPHGVVKVAGRLAVDGHDVVGAKVFAPRQFQRPDLAIDGAGLIENVRRESMRDVVFADDDLNVDAEIIGAPEHFDDTPNGGLAFGGKLNHLRFHDVAVQIFGRLDLGWWLGNAYAIGQRWQRVQRGNLDPLVNPVVMRLNKAPALVDAKFADDRGVRPLRDADDVALGPSVSPEANDARRDLVSVHRLGGGIGGQK